MADFSKCPAVTCPLMHECQRFLEPFNMAANVPQMFYLIVPYDSISNSCDMFMDKNVLLSQEKQ